MDNNIPDQHRRTRRESLGLGKATVKVVAAIIAMAVGFGGAAGGETIGLWEFGDDDDNCRVVTNDDD